MPDPPTPPRQPADRLADVRPGALRRSAATLAVLLVGLGLFLWMVHSVLLAALLGAVVAVSLRAPTGWLEGRLGHPRVSAVLALAAVVLPVAAILVYGAAEIHGAGEYLARHTDQVTREVSRGLRRLPLVGGGAEESVRGVVETAGRRVTELPAGFRSAATGFTVAAAVFLLTAYYLLTDGRAVVAYVRESIPERWAPLAEALESNVTGVLRGTLLAVFVTQALKAAVILALNLSLGVPLPFTLAAAAFVIGLFPVLGTWTVYVPAAAYLLVFEDAPVRAAIMVGVGFGASTVLLSLWLRPRLGADRSHVLNFYWMFIGLVAGALTFGPAGLLVGPLLIGVLKAALDTLRTPGSWRPGDGGSSSGSEAEFLSHEELRARP